jgi:hypothetical protein
MLIYIAFGIVIFLCCSFLFGVLLGKAIAKADADAQINAEQRVADSFACALIEEQFTCENLREDLAYAWNQNRLLRAGTNDLAAMGRRQAQTIQRLMLQQEQLTAELEGHNMAYARVVLEGKP